MSLRARLIPNATGFETSIEHGCEIDHHPGKILIESEEPCYPNSSTEAKVDLSSLEAIVPSSEKSYSFPCRSAHCRLSMAFLICIGQTSQSQEVSYPMNSIL